MTLCVERGIIIKSRETKPSYRICDALAATRPVSRKMIMDIYTREHAHS